MGPPVAVTDTVTTEENQPVVVDLLNNDTDPDGDGKPDDPTVTTLVQFPELRIMEAVVESFNTVRSGLPSARLMPLPEIEGIDTGQGYIKKVKTALQDREIPDGLLDALVDDVPE